MKTTFRPSAKTPRHVGRPKDVAKREDIVAAATDLFMKDGYELTSMDAVAKKAEVSKLTIYSHFANKVDLFGEVIRYRCDKSAMPECFLALAQQSPEEALMEISRRLATLIFSPDSIRLQRIMQAEAAHHPKIIRIFYDAGPKRVRKAFGDLLREWTRQKKLAVPDISVATEQFFSLLKGELLMKTMLLLDPLPRAQEINKHAKATVTFFLAAYRPRTKN